MTKRRKSKSGAGRLAGSDRYTQEIIKRLARVTAVSGYGAGVIFNDWTQLVQASLDALPQHLKAIARSGHWAEDPPDTAQTFANIQTRYENGSNSAASQRVWDSFGQAFGLLLESAAPGLWAFDYNSGYMGPDVLGQVFMEYTHPDPHQGQFLTPWPVVLMMSQLNSGGKSLVYDRLKQACQHPDNLLAQAALLAGLAIEDPHQAQEWFMTRVVPAALPHYEIVKVCDPCVGSGRMLLGMALQFEPWMVHSGLVQFFGQDISPLMTRLSTINCYLYGLNGYALKLAEAVNEVRDTASQYLPTSAGEALRQVYQTDTERQTPASPTFQELFARQAVEAMG